MNITCPVCGAALHPGETQCAACLLSAGAITLPVQPVSIGVAALPCLLGDYRLLKKLGQGGMGIVYEAEHQPSGRRLALKVLNQGMDNEAQRQRFLREGRLAATIDHPNSVYVFGTEEIDGIPVIAMELARGGTLRDELKRRGPLPVRDAVDAILGIIDGLEAAHAKGVLHRDMKPSNCFVTSEGKAIVGDYGLSISQAPDAQHLTQSGLIIGTPAFSPPEQLRGLPLDQRADIYSTAGTLYYLLTGKAPVERTSSVETVAAVLEGRIPNVRTLRSEVSEDLAAVIAKCLSPDAAKRPSTYADARALLMPFSSSAADPAPLGLRLLAGFLDDVIGWIVFYALVLMHLTSWNAEPQWLDSVWNVLIMLPCAALLTARLGATPGQWLCGLRVQALDGARPGWWRALQWHAWFLLGSLACGWLAVGLSELTGLDADTIDSLWTIPFIILTQLYLLYFLPAFRRTDRAAWHDVRSLVRVVRHRETSQRKRAADALPKVVEGDVETWGPYSPGVVISSELRCGYDPMLRRRVLLRRVGEEPLSDARRDCARGGRLRWLQRVTDGTGCRWDVWQALAGVPLSTLLSDSTPTWSEMLFWLQDVSSELESAIKDDTLPSPLSLDQVWITDDGRAVLLDEPWLQVSSGVVVDDPQRLLHHLAMQVPAVERPVHADDLVRGLESSVFERLSHVSGNLAHLRQKRSTVSAMARAACVLSPMLAAASMFTGICLIANALYSSGWEIAQPGQPPLPDVLRLDPEPGQPFQTDVAVRKQMRVHLKGHYHDMETNKELLELLGKANAKSMNKSLRIILAEEPTPTPEALAAADIAVRAAVKSMPNRGVFAEANFSKAIAVLSLIAIFTVACFQLLSLALGGPPLLMRLTGMALVTTNRRPASRPQMLKRWLIGWSALWSIALVLLIAFLASGYDPIRKLHETAMIWVPVMLMLMIMGLLWPRRCLLDRLAGTWIVPR